MTTATDRRLRQCFYGQGTLRWTHKENRANQRAPNIRMGCPEQASAGEQITPDLPSPRIADIFLANVGSARRTVARAPEPLRPANPGRDQFFYTVLATLSNGDIQAGPACAGTHPQDAA